MNVEGLLNVQQQQQQPPAGSESENENENELEDEAKPELEATVYLLTFLHFTFGMNWLIP